MCNIFMMKGILMCLDVLDEDSGPIVSAGNSKG